MRHYLVGGCTVAVICAGLLASNAYAVPSFSRQTGMSCANCHTVFPELTPFGRSFKAQGYTLSTVPAVTDESHGTILDLIGMPPLSIMLLTSFSHTREAQTLAAGSPPARNGDVELPQQLGLFYAGKIAPKVGGMIQLTYDGRSDHFTLDNTDIRFAQTVKLADKNLTFGFSLNNNPTVTDLWNSTPAWGAPFASSNVTPAPAAAPLVFGRLAQSVAGLGAYGFWNDTIYAEVDLYRSAPLGVSRPLDSANGAVNVIDQVSPYWRAAFQYNHAAHSFELGTFGLAASLLPGGLAPLQGATDHFVDVALDGQYQYIGDHHLVSLAASWIHEAQRWDASHASGLTENLFNHLDMFRVNASYFFDRFIGGQLGFFSVNGTSDAGLYAPALLTGSRNGSPSSNSVVAQLDFIPWLNTKFTVQYVTFINFNGARGNYDGSGRSAQANDTLYLLSWLSF
jgi:hypothetical protein